MISDGGDELVAFARLQASITALTSDRIEAGKKPSARYDPTDGPLLLISARGGPRDQESPVRQRTFYLFSYAADEATAALLDAAVSAAMHRRFIPGAGAHLFQVAENQPGEEPDAQWPYTMSIYQLRGFTS